MTNITPNRFETCRRWFIEAPGPRTLITGIYTVVGGAFSALFMAEISSARGFDWTGWYHTRSIYVLAVAIFIQYKHQRAIYEFDRQVGDLADIDSCLSYLAKECIPEMARGCKARIRKGDTKAFKEATDQLRKSLK